MEIVVRFDEECPLTTIERMEIVDRVKSRDGTWRELKARAFYEKPSVKKRRRQRAVRRRLLKLEKLSAE